MLTHLERTNTGALRITTYSFETQTLENCSPPGVGRDEPGEMFTNDVQETSQLAYIKRLTVIHVMLILAAFNIVDATQARTGPEIGVQKRD